MKTPSKIKASLCSFFGLLALVVSGSVSAQAGSDEDGYCDSVDVHSDLADCALSTVCGKVREHFSKPFTGNFSDYFSVRYLPDSTCEILAFRKQVLYKCMNPQGEKFLGELDYAGYPPPGEAHRHQAICKSLLSRHLDDPGCEESEESTDPGCEQPGEPEGGKPQDPGKDPEKDPGNDPEQDPGKNPELDPKSEPGEESTGTSGSSTEPESEPSTDPGTNPNPGEDNTIPQKHCESPHGRCTVSGHSLPAQATGVSASSQVSVSCQSQSGVHWGYTDHTPRFELVREEQLQVLCGQELALCVDPLRGGQAQFFGFTHHPERKTSAECTTSAGRCRVSTDANGHGYVDCQCALPGVAATQGMVYGMEPGLKGAQAQCFLEVERCAAKNEDCPGGCDKKGRSIGPNGGCAMVAGAGSGRGPYPVYRGWFGALALLGLFSLRRRN